MESACLDSNRGVSLKKKLKSISTETTISSSESSDSGCFDCNICLESSRDPVVTLCGHLYCWPCIYKWLRVQSSSSEPDQQMTTCPVCKAEISHTSLVPLYGRGTSHSDPEAKKLQTGLGIPHRPSPYNSNAMLTAARASTSHQGQQLHPNYFHSHPRPLHYQQSFPHLHGGYGASGVPYLGGAAMTSFFNPMLGTFGEMVLTRIFGISDANLFSYSHNGSGSVRMRRQEMQIDKSLNRVSVFLLCCIILCFLLF